ncbi:HPr kinase/phosphorylase [Sphingomonas sp. GlSt437]|uniref:HPr kinase/phosphorylase n=1 Tax=Sphingomonas sp. GlSt437 TaxID=3389970 RepID=UPI003A8BC089
MATPLSSETLHATTVAIEGRAVLIEGGSGAGKSDLALRLLDRGAALVSDDYTLLHRRGNALLATAPATIAGKLEVRGLGIIDWPHVEDVPVALVVMLTDDVERLPADPPSRRIAGVSVPAAEIDPRAASAAIKVELALRRVKGPA